MSRKILVPVLAVMAAGVLIAGGIAYAQTPAPFTWSGDQDPGSTARTFSFFVDGSAFLGVGTEDITKENMARYAVREVRGVGVTEVTKDSPAEKAGLRKDDVIVRFDGESPDQNVRITISRGGAEQELTATLTKRKMDNVFGSTPLPRILRGDEDGVQVFPAPSWPPSATGGEGPLLTMIGANRRIGVSTQNLTPQLAEYFGVKEGVLVTSVSDNSPAAKAGLKAGDIITTIDGEKVSSPGELSRGIGKKETGDVTLTVVRDRNTRTVTVTPEKNPNADLLRTRTMGTRTISIPSIQVPAIPPIEIQVPSITVPATPPVEVTVPSRAPRIVRSRSVII